jgi:hypothetical protein
LQHELELEITLIEAGPQKVAACCGELSDILDPAESDFPFGFSSSLKYYHMTAIAC